MQPYGAVTDETIRDSTIKLPPLELSLPGRYQRITQFKQAEMHFQRLFLSAFAAAALSIVHATQLFSNHGTTGGWTESYIDPGCGGTIEQVTNIVKEGSTALKMTHNHDPNYHGLY